MHVHCEYLKKTESYPPRKRKGTIWAFTNWQANTLFNSQSQWKCHVGTCLKIQLLDAWLQLMYMWLTNIGSFWIISIQIGHSAGVAGIIKDLWNLKSILVTNLFWVTWSPAVKRWRVSFCFTVKSYTLLYYNNILRLKSTNLGWSCTSSWKMKYQIKKQHLPKVTCLQ